MEQLLIEIYRNPNVWGFFMILSIQLVKMLRDWLVTKSVSKKSKINMQSLNDRIDAIDVRTEHYSFIISFTDEIERYRELIFNNFKFSNKDYRYIANEIASRMINIFVGIMKRGYDNYNQKTLEQSFDMYEVKLITIINTINPTIHPDKIMDIIQTNKELFFIDIEAITPKKNGARQEAYENLCKNIIKSITMKISEF